MTKYEYIENANKILNESFSDKLNNLINSKQGLRESIYCSFVGFVNNYLSNFKYFKSMIDEIDNEIFDTKELNYVEALYLIIKKETSITLKRDICKEIIKYLSENKNNIEYYEY